MTKSRNFDRRTIISVVLGSFALSPRLSWARGTPGMLKLRDEVRIPASALTRDWQQQPFEAWVSSGEFLTAGASDKGTFDRLFLGALLRLPGHEQYLAYCTLCSHEACEVKLLKDTRSVKLEETASKEHPLVVCPCHFSVFDPGDQGRVLKGPAPRGLYTFKYHRDGDDIVVTHIESDAISLFQA